LTKEKPPVEASGAKTKRGRKDTDMAKKSVEKARLELVQLKSSKKPDKPAQLGTSRGIESMFRNSYRAQLDMITLAATKANIMISLNGLLVSILLISGTYFLNVEPMLIIPLISFLLTCTVAIIFAVLAARPAVDNKKRVLEDFRNDDADLLVFEHFAKLPREEYLDAMQEMVQNNDRIYRNMIVHIHTLGSTANHKFKRLYVSYTAFMTGLVISVLLLLAVIAYSVLTGA